jgi:hypothetical protein
MVTTIACPTLLKISACKVQTLLKNLTMDMDWTSVALMGEKAGHEVISRSTTIVTKILIVASIQVQMPLNRLV